MRSFALILAAVPLVFAAAACQVTTDSNNDSVEVAYNEELAANAADDARNLGADVANVADNVADDIGNDIDREADKVDDKVVVNTTSNKTN